LDRYDEISSTEKLLDLIRHGDSGEPEIQSESTADPGDAPKRSFMGRLLPFGRSVGLGVDIGYTELKVAKIGYTLDRKPQLLGLDIVPFEEGLTRDSPEFPRFLRAHLKRFSMNAGKMNIWSIISGAKVEMRHLRIPKLPPSQIPNAAYWTYKKEGEFDEDEFLFDFELLKETTEEGIKKNEVFAYIAPFREIESLKTIFSRAGTPLSGLLTVPFAMQALFRSGWLTDSGRNICSVYIGRNWSRIDLFSEGNLILSRGVKAGMNSMIEAIEEGFYERQIGPGGGIQMTGESLAETVVVDRPVDMGEARKIFFGLIEDGDIPREWANRLGVDAEDVFQMCLQAAERLTRQIERTLEHFSQEHGGERADRIYLTGPMGAYHRLMDYMNEQLAVPVVTMDPFDADPRAMESVFPPDSSSSRESFAPAMGLALAGETRGPNFINTYKDRQETSSVRRINRIVAMVSIAIILALGGVHLWQSTRISREKANTARLRTNLSVYAPRLKQGDLLTMLARVKKTRTNAVELGLRYRPVALMSELSELTPPQIRLLSLKTDFSESADAAGQKPGQASKRPAAVKSASTLELQGFVFGDKLNMETALTGYLISLEGSPVFGRPSIANKTFETVEGRDALRFSAKLELL